MPFPFLAPFTNSPTYSAPLEYLMVPFPLTQFPSTNSATATASELGTSFGSSVSSSSLNVSLASNGAPITSLNDEKSRIIDREDNTMNLVLILEQEHFQYKIWIPKEWIVV